MTESEILKRQEEMNPTPPTLQVLKRIEQLLKSIDKKLDGENSTIKPWRDPVPLHEINRAKS